VSSPSPPVLECDMLLCDVLLRDVLECDMNLVSIRKQRVEASLEATRSLVSKTHPTCLSSTPTLTARTEVWDLDARDMTRAET